MPNQLMKIKQFEGTNVSSILTRPDVPPNYVLKVRQLRYDNLIAPIPLIPPVKISVNGEYFLENESYTINYNTGRINWFSALPLTEDDTIIIEYLVNNNP